MVFVNVLEAVNGFTNSPGVVPLLFALFQAKAVFRAADIGAVVEPTTCLAWNTNFQWRETAWNEL